MKKVVIIGGSGTVGKILYKGLSEIHDCYVLDNRIEMDNSHFIYVDATNYQQLLEKIPLQTDVIINLLRMETDNAIEDIEAFNKMTAVFFQASYYILQAANQLNISKVIFASSNHVTDYYEEDGDSLLNREINVKDYPYPKGLYGVLKLASEQLGFIYYLNSDMSIINIRIGSVPAKSEQKAIEENSRLEKTILHKRDLIELFSVAITSKEKFGTYYGVSNNPGKPWNISNATTELGYQPE